MRLFSDAFVSDLVSVVFDGVIVHGGAVITDARGHTWRRPRAGLTEDARPSRISFAQIQISSAARPTAIAPATARATYSANTRGRTSAATATAA